MIKPYALKDIPAAARTRRLSNIILVELIAGE
jgi:hypothetical protein